MKKILFIILFLFIFFVLEYFLFNLFGAWFTPDFLLLFIIFITLWQGIRYSMTAAILSGILKDSFSISTTGVNLISYVICAYATVILARYIYRHGSISRYLLISLIVLLNSFLHVVLMLFYQGIYIFDSLWFSVFPEIITTILISSFTFHFLKRCASKLYV